MAGGLASAHTRNARRADFLKFFNILSGPFARRFLEPAGTGIPYDDWMTLL
jgi:hypothetical protein